MKSKEFFINKGLGERTRLDTFFILSCIYDYVEDKGINDEVISAILSLRNYLDKNRDLIKNKDYPIIQLKTMLERLNFLFGENLLSEEDKEDIIKRVEEGNIKEKGLNKEKLKLEENYFRKEYLKEVVVDNSSEEDILNKRGIYGIYINDKICYIGRTKESFKERMRDHAKNIENSDEYKYRILRKAKQNGNRVSMCPLIAIEDLKMENKRSFTTNELNCMELALITYLKPMLNTEGVRKPYVFRK